MNDTVAVILLLLIWYTMLIIVPIMRGGVSALRQLIAHTKAAKIEENRCREYYELALMMERKKDIDAQKKFTNTLLYGVSCPEIFKHYDNRN